MYMQNMNKTVGLDMAKLNLFFMKPNNLTCQTCLRWVYDIKTGHFAVRAVEST